MRIVLFFALSAFFLTQCQNAPTTPATTDQQTPANGATAAAPAEQAVDQAAHAAHDMPGKSAGLAAKLAEKIEQAAPAPRFANTIDFICEMEVQPDYTDTCHYQGKVYAFCSEHCKEEFKADPKKYLKQ